MLSLQASLYIPLLTFYLSLFNLNSALDSNPNPGLCTPYPCNQPPQPPFSTGYTPYGNPPPPSPPSSPPPKPRSNCPPVSSTGCCNQPPPSMMYSPPYPYFYTPPYPYGTLGGGGENFGGQGTGAAVSYDCSFVSVYVLVFVLSYAFVVL